MKISTFTKPYRNLHVIWVSLLVFPAIGQTITLGNTGSSGGIVAVDTANTSYNLFDFNNNGEFLVVTLSGVAANDVNTSLDQNLIDVTYNNISLTRVDFINRSNDSFAGVWYLANPDTGSHALDFDFGQDAFTGGGAAPEGTWQYGAMSLSNVNESDPIAGSTAFNANTGDFLINPQTPGEIGAGDFLTVGVGTTGATNHYDTATMGDTELWGDTPNTRGYSALYQILTAGDINGSGQVPITDIGIGSSQATVGVVFNAAVIPEISTLAMLGLSMVGLLAFRRKR